MRFAKALLTLLVTALLCAPTALASGDDVVRDCADDGQLSKRYTSAELREAFNTIPTDVDEYTDCRDVIRRAQLAGSGGGAGGTDGAGGAGVGSGSGGGSGATGTGDGATPAAGGVPGGDQLAGATPEERRQVDALRADRDRGGRIGDRVVRASGGSGGAEVPTPLLVMLTLGVLAAAGAAGYAVRSRGLTRGTA